MNTPSIGRWKSSGFRRLVNAARHQLDGIKHGLESDSAIRQLSFVVFALCVLALFMPVTKLETLLLILPLLLVALVEYLNSAIEAMVDRVSLDSHPLSKIAVVMSLVSWAVILGPLFARS